MKLPRLGVRRRLRRYARTVDESIRGARADVVRRRSVRSRHNNPVVLENLRTGSSEWQMGDAGTRPGDDRGMQIKGYASSVSVAPGEAVSFHVTVECGEDFTIAIHRVGHYGGTGARRVAASPRLPGIVQKPPEVDESTGMIACRWPAVWTVEVGEDWVSGYYLAVFTTQGGWRSYTPFVVRDDRRRASFCVIIPFTTYAAYNLWPLDGVRGRSLYYGHDLAQVDENGAHPLAAERRSFRVSFERPFDKDGMPNLADLDQSFIRWAEAAGYDMTYATSADLHAGRIDASRFDGLVFSGHDEYWSADMRRHADQAVSGGTALAFLSANSVYWHIRFAPGLDGTPDRSVVCHKRAPDPSPSPPGATGRWRDPRPCPADPEQRLLGVMYNGIVATPAPLVVKNARHWFWHGTGVRNGQQLRRLVTGEADGFVADSEDPGPIHHRRQVLLSASPFTPRTGANMIQNTSVIDRSRTRAMIFVAGALHWPRALGRVGPDGDRIRQATANVLDRIIYYARRRR